MTYCSEECSNLDAISPSISSSSSVLSSPFIDYAMAGEVPALVPSALGNALSDYRNRNRYSVSSSSASSVSWSALTDDEDDISVGVEDDNSIHHGGSDAPSSIYERSITSTGLSGSKPSSSSALSYARRPSATNHRATVSSMHRRTSSTSSGSGLSPSAPRSIPSEPFTENDSDSVVGSDYRADSDLSERDHDEHSTISSKPKRSRNRASLPAYFSLLQMNSPKHPSPISSSINSRASPPTPKLPLAAGPVTSASKAKLSLISAVGVPSTVEATPRGRRQEAGTAQSGRWTEQSRSRSRSRSRKPSQLYRPDIVLPEQVRPRGRMDSRSSVEKVFDWKTGPVTRGRPAVRRNSSPLPKMMLSRAEFEPATSENRARTGTRGRLAVNELDGMGISTQAPGFGNGRSGLLSRERAPMGRSVLGL